MIFLKMKMFCFSAYNAVGLASFDLFDEIDFDSWFTNHLLQELQVKHKRWELNLVLVIFFQYEFKLV